MKFKIIIPIAITLAGGIGIAMSLGGQPTPIENPMTMANVDALTTLEDVVIICDEGKDGQCFAPITNIMKDCNGAYFHPCKFTGDQRDECYQPCF